MDFLLGLPMELAFYLLGLGWVMLSSTYSKAVRLAAYIALLLLWLLPVGVMLAFLGGSLVQKLGFYLLHYTLATVMWSLLVVGWWRWKDIKPNAKIHKVLRNILVGFCAVMVVGVMLALFGLRKFLVTAGLVTLALTGISLFLDWVNRR